MTWSPGWTPEQQTGVDRDGTVTRMEQAAKKLAADAFKRKRIAAVQQAVADAIKPVADRLEELEKQVERLTGRRAAN